MSWLDSFELGTAGWRGFDPARDVAVIAWYRRSEQPGPTVLLTAGIHGDEYEGPPALLQVVKRLTDTPMRGSVACLPVANPLAYADGARCTPEDGKDLARTFPGNPEGTVTDRLAAAIFDHLASSADYLINLHSGGVEYAFLPLAGFYGEPSPKNPSYVAARNFGLPGLWRLPPTDGDLCYEMWKRGKVAIGLEYMGCGRASAAGIAAYAEGCVSCLKLWGVLDGAAAPASSRVYSGNWQLAPVTGLFIAQKNLGDPVERGDVVARILSIPFGDSPIVAETSGILLGLRSKALIQEANRCVLIGAPEVEHEG